MNRNPDDTPGYVSLKIIDEIPPFQSPIEFEFDPEVNVFIGPNATGKSTILKLLCRGFPHNVDSDRFDVEWTGGRIPPQIYLPPVRDVAPGSPSEYGRIGSEEVSDDFLQGFIYDAVLEVLGGESNLKPGESNLSPGEVCDGVKEWGIRTVIDRAWQGLGPINTIDEGKFEVELGRFFNHWEPWFDDVHGAVHEKEFVTAARAAALSQLQEFDGGRFLLNGPDPYITFPAVRVKLALDRLRREAPDRWAQVMNVAADCCYDICPEVFTGEVDAWRVVEHSGSLVVSETSHPGEGFGVRGAAGDAIVYIGQLSTGTQGLWWWLCWLALRLTYGSSRSPFQQPAILLIDEIENHLHPTWQRRVIPALRKHFPGLQIFATTHSPFVVAGLKKGQVHLLQRDADGVVTTTTNERDVIGWTADEILQTLMGVDEPTDQLTIDRAARLRQLRGQETLTPEEESEMNELRRQVNADLLDRGGDSDIDLEDYASLMRQVLLARQSDLSQEGD